MSRVVIRSITTGNPYGVVNFLNACLSFEKYITSIISVLRVTINVAKAKFICLNLCFIAQVKLF